MFLLEPMRRDFGTCDRGAGAGWFRAKSRGRRMAVVLALRRPITSVRDNRGLYRRLPAKGLVAADAGRIRDIRRAGP